MPIGTEIGRGHGIRTVSGLVVHGILEGAVPVPQEYGDAVPIRVGGHKVRMAVSVEVSHGHGMGRLAQARAFPVDS